MSVDEQKFENSPEDSMQEREILNAELDQGVEPCLLYTSPSPRD